MVIPALVKTVEFRHVIGEHIGRQSHGPSQISIILYFPLGG